MTYRVRSDPKVRAVTMVAVLGLHAALIAGLSLLAVNVPRMMSPDPVDIFDVTQPDPPRPLEIEEPDRNLPKNEGRASKVETRSELSPITVPPRLVQTPLFNPAAASIDPNVGRDISYGTLERGGTGAGVAGAGEGAQTDLSRRPSLIEETRLKLRDYSRMSRRGWRRGEQVMVAFRVEADGRPTSCRVIGTSGVGVIDVETCWLVERKVRLRPALDKEGKPHASSFQGYVHYEDIL
ncbi:energy transducer TonB [Sphingomicrobium flavum]|uniref:energy transducer TonB n=1 Tax=Sphingomicrobium flavum TaxID=1229164 RepID=UPI0021AD9DF3|nr:energy transducer TonB [Sphingomicrobium flavum]